MQAGQLFSKISRVPLRLLLVAPLNLSGERRRRPSVRRSPYDKLRECFAFVIRGTCFRGDLKANARRTLVFKHDVANVHYKARYSRHGVRRGVDTHLRYVVFNFSLSRTLTGLMRHALKLPEVDTANLLIGPPAATCRPPLPFPATPPFSLLVPCTWSSAELSSSSARKKKTSEILSS